MTKTVHQENLQAFVTRIYEKLGVPDKDARVAARNRGRRRSARCGFPRGGDVAPQSGLYA